MEQEIDYERLRRDLMDYFVAAMMYYPVAVMDLSKVERASEEELISIAIKNGFDINKYIVEYKPYKL